MEWLNPLLAVIAGLALRLAIPIAVTALAAYILRRLDERWQEEAAQLPAPPPLEKIHCWEIHNCPVEKMKNCPAPASAEPCWQIHRLPNGYLREACLDCEVFRQAPIPAPIPIPIQS